MPDVPATPHSAMQSRRRVLAVLLATATATLIAAVVASQPSVWALQVTVDLLLVGYLGTLIHARNVSAGIEMSRRVLDR